MSDESRRGDERPDPDALLEVAQAEERAVQRGKLRIFFGACPGVGKTYTMLSKAQQLRRQGVDVVVGVVETHGREDTLRLLQGLPRIKPRTVEYRGRTYQEFDLAQALYRQPSVLLVDELAHTNLPGGLHEKRWQDVEDLLNAGIDVYTTLNVQHLESVADLVSRIVNAPVRETVPDTIFQNADDVVLVDLPADDILQRLREGKVYVPGQAQRALQNFFRKANLIVLRQLALRVTTERVDAQMQSYRTSIQSGQGTAGAAETLLLCIGPRDRGSLVRATSRLAEALHARWYAVYVETPQLQRLPTQARQQILRTLQQARDLGARTAILSGPDPSQEVIDFARRQGLRRIVIGRGSRRDLRRFFPHRPFVKRLASKASDLDLILLAGKRSTAKSSETQATEETVAASIASRAGKLPWRGYGYALMAAVVATLVAGGTLALFDWLRIPGISFTDVTMIYLFAVVAVAWRHGRGPAALAAVANVAALDFFYGVFHRHAHAVGLQDVVSFAVLVAVGLIVGQITFRARYQTRVAQHRERRFAELYALARDLASALTEDQVAALGLRFFRRAFDARALIVLSGFQLRFFGDHDPEAAPVELETARWVLERGEAAGAGTNTLAGAESHYHPLKSGGTVYGVVVLQPRSQRLLRIPETLRHLDTGAMLIGMTLERLKTVAASHEMMLDIQTQRLRAGILSVLSRDLRRPLEVIVAEATRLVPELPEGALHSRGVELLNRIHDFARMIDDFLEMERIEGSGAQLRRRPTALATIVEAAQTHVDLRDHPLRIDVPADLPDLSVDEALMARVFANLLRNGIDHTASGTPITIQARANEDACEIVVWDTGPGIVPGQEEAIFARGMTTAAGSDEGHPGIGLALSRAIVEAHGGTLRARNRVGGGAEFVITLPFAPAPSAETRFPATTPPAAPTPGVPVSTSGA